MNKQALIIGATASLAVPLSRQLAAQGWQLVLAGRDREELSIRTNDLIQRYGGIHSMLTLDLLEIKADETALTEAIFSSQSIFILAGDMGKDVANAEDIIRTIQINFSAPAYIITLAARIFESRGFGDIVVVSSVAGDRGRASNYPYGSAKAGLSTFTDGLRHRMATHANIQVMTVKPGFLDTPMTFSMRSPLICRREKAAAIILRAWKKKKHSIYVPGFWRWIMAIIRNIPEPIFLRTKL